MGRDNHKETNNNPTSLPKKQKTNPGQMKEEISLELEEIGNLNPKHEPMTQNYREKSQAEKTYK